jgi:hypothetical protein
VAWAGPWNGVFNDPLNTILKPLARFGILHKLRYWARERQFNRTSLNEYDYGKEYDSSTLFNQDDDTVYLQDLISAFFLLGIGYGLAFVALVGEFLYSCCSKGHHYDV